MKQLKRQIRMYKEEKWIVTISKTKFDEIRNGSDGLYEFWLNNEEYGHMMYIWGHALKDWNEAKDYIWECLRHDFLRSYVIEIKKLEAEENYPTTNSFPLVDIIIPYKMKGVNDGNEKKNEKAQRQEGLHTDSK